MPHVWGCSQAGVNVTAVSGLERSIEFIGLSGQSVCKMKKIFRPLQKDLVLKFQNNQLNHRWI